MNVSYLHQPGHPFLFFGNRPLIIFGGALFPPARPVVLGDVPTSASREGVWALHLDFQNTATLGRGSCFKVMLGHETPTKYILGNYWGPEAAGSLGESLTKHEPDRDREGRWRKTDLNPWILL